MDTKINTRDTITLLSLPKVGRKTARKLIAVLRHKISGPADLFDFVAENGAKNGLPFYTQSEKDNAVREAEMILDRSEKMDIRVLTFLDPDYPPQLLDTPDFPVVLSFKGNIGRLTNMPTVAVIGTREPSAYGQKVGERVGQLFGSLKFNVVSGLAVGCDAAGHTGALQGHGTTTAVLAHGLDHVYPKENRPLAENILSNDGLLVSEYFVGQRPIGTFFVERDRIQAGLSQSVFIVETDVKGGTMHTARFCREYKRKLVAFNHPPEHRSHPKAQGNRMLIQQGDATPIYSKDEMNTLALLLLDQFMEEKDGPSAKQTFLWTFGDIFFHRAFESFNWQDSYAFSTKVAETTKRSILFDFDFYSNVYHNIANEIKRVDWFKTGQDDSNPSKLNLTDFLHTYSNSNTQIFTDFLKEVYHDLIDIDILLGLTPGTAAVPSTVAPSQETEPTTEASQEIPPFALEHQPTVPKRGRKKSKKSDNGPATGDSLRDSTSAGSARGESKRKSARHSAKNGEITATKTSSGRTRKNTRKSPPGSVTEQAPDVENSQETKKQKDNPQQEIWSA